MRTNPLIPSGLAQRAEPESFRARIFSASLEVKDIQKSLAWYRDKVGFFVEQKFERQGKLRGVSLKAGDVRILISQDDGGTGWDRVKGAGFTLQFTTAQDIDSLAQAIKERGGWLESEPADESGVRVLRLRDPDGFRLVISAAR
jgi:catechol 2,3-dioxygenase-like lactoylglutathione lyase family enzyme